MTITKQQICFGSEFTSILGGSGNFGICREEHHVSEFTGRWRNLTFTDNIEITARDNHRASNFPWGTYPSGNFFLIARVVATNESYKCGYEGHEDRYLRGDGGELIGWDYNPDWIRLEKVMIWVPNRNFEGVHQEFSHWELTIDRTPSLNWRATVPEGVEIQLYYGTDLIGVSGSEQADNLWIMGMGSHNTGMAWESWWDYLSESGLANGVWQVSGLITVGDPQPPQETVEIKFDGYLEKVTATTYTNGRDWMPQPEDAIKKWIGLVYTSTDAQEQLEADIIYEVFDITTWQGMSMNEPRILEEDDKPHPTGDTDRFFDFKVDNPFYTEEGDYKYDIRIIDTDEYIAPFDGDGDGRPELGGRFYSTRRYTVQRKVRVQADTLWFIAQDYAAHAVVLTHGRRYTSPLRNRDWTNPITGEDLWNVTVPRDYDGYQSVGINKGDYMADIWEEENAASVDLPRYSSQILGFYPFYLRDDAGDFSMNLRADMDSSLTGAAIEGDRFTNFEEYRGVHCTGDPDTPVYSSLQHKRFNPRYKTLLIDWRRKFIPRNVRESISLFDNKLDPSEMFYVDAYITNDNDTRFSLLRHVALNRIGAYFDYVSCPEITNDPLSGSLIQNAISFWELNSAERDFQERRRREDPNNSIDPDRNPAWTESDPPAYLDPHRYPEFHSRIVVVPNNLRKWKTTLGVYYWNNPGQWKDAVKNMVAWMFQHEIGHTVAMTHEISQNYMNLLIPIQYDTLLADYGIFFPVGTIYDYSNNSKSEFSIVPPPPPEQP